VGPIVWLNADADGGVDDRAGCAVGPFAIGCRTPAPAPRAPCFLDPERELATEAALRTGESSFFFERLAQRRPQALQSVFGPFGPLRHSGESVRPQVTQTYFSTGGWALFGFLGAPSSSSSMVA